VGVRGPIDPVIGYVIDLGLVKDIVEREVIDQVDHRNLNLDVPWLTGVNPTTENLVVRFWDRIAPAIAPAQLMTLRLRETENNFVEYSGE
jgi:6-pyruvoyltetrahydropterin/6-carboxytetrahydropterin synthase